VAAAARVAAAALVAGMLVSCAWGVAEPVPERLVGSATEEPTTTSFVARYVPAPTARPAQALPDPRCRAARRLFLRAAVAPTSGPLVVDGRTDELLRHATVLAQGPARADLDGFRTFVDRFRTDPGSLTEADLEASVARMDRLLRWTITVCPPPQRPVWGCSAQVSYGRPDPFDSLYFVVVGQPSPDAAVDETLGEVTGRRVELARSSNRVVYGWLDIFGLVRRRVEVERIYDLWHVADASRCDDPIQREHPFDTGEVIVEELPDAGDGPEYAPSTTVPEEVTTSTTEPLEPCRYDPDDTTDQYETLGEYMAYGPAEPGCWDRLTPEGRDCLDDPPSGEFFACFDV
jgi:hypothetical protein